VFFLVLWCPGGGGGGGRVKTEKEPHDGEV